MVRQVTIFSDENLTISPNQCPMKIKALFIVALFLCCEQYLKAAELPFEKEIAAYEAKFKENLPVENSTMFVGSSTWRLWQKQLEQDFAELKAVNVGFGGASIPDLLRAADRIVIPHKPAKIAFFCGGNDVARKMTPDIVLSNFKKYLAKIWKVDPLCEIYFVSVTHAPVRNADWPQSDQFNDSVKALADKLDGLYFIDIRPAMNDENGNIREELFLQDRLHLNRSAREIWMPIILDAIKNGQERKNVIENQDAVEKQRNETLKETE